MWVPLDKAAEESTYGGKAVNLGAAIRAGLPVPPGFAISTEAVDSIVAGDRDAISLLHDAFARLDGAVAVRSSAIEEDSLLASFAGQYTTRLNVSDESDLVNAVREVWESTRSEAVAQYRRDHGLTGTMVMGVVLQRLVVPDMAGVLFTRNPVTDADERVIEASWGLGEAVVMGLVIPDQFRVSRQGEVLERTLGRKDRMIRPSAGGDTEEVAVEPGCVHTLCLDDAHLFRLHEMASQCETITGTARDIEWAFAAGALHLLQHRAVTG